MDLDGDGQVDILSGSYSYVKQGLAGVLNAMAGRPTMAGTFQVLAGQPNGGFAVATPLRGSDGGTLIIRSKYVLARICTRPFAADLNGDGNLDIIAGNFGGSFAFFAGEQGGKYAPRNSWLERDGVRLRVAAHSDPFLIDWDRDGDLDLLSGSNEGGAFLFANIGSRTEPRWAERVTLLEPSTPNVPEDEVVFGADSIAGPQASTRIWVDDVDGDGKLDLLIGDDITLNYPAEGLDQHAARKALSEWVAKRETLGNSNEPDAWQKHWAQRDQIIRTAGTGYVWLLRQK